MHSRFLAGREEKSNPGSRMRSGGTLAHCDLCATAVAGVAVSFLVVRAAESGKMKTKATAPVPQPGPIRKLARKKAKKKFRKSKALAGSGTLGSRPAAVAGGPPRAPENFSQNWKALQEVRPATGHFHPKLSVR